MKIMNTTELGKSTVFYFFEVRLAKEELIEIRVDYILETKFHEMS